MGVVFAQVYTLRTVALGGFHIKYMPCMFEALNLNSSTHRKTDQSKENSIDDSSAFVVSVDCGMIKVYSSVYP